MRDPPFTGQPLVPDLLSIAAEPEAGNAFSEAIGFGGEAFWWSADASLDVPAGGALPIGGGALLVLAQEAAFVNATPVDGDQFAFGRVRVRMDAPFAGTYTVATPYGDLPSFTVTAGANAINFTNDVGDVPPFANRALLLDQNPIGPFLVATSAPAGHLGDPAAPSTVTGSPTGQNVFSITGPFNGTGTSVTLTTDLFAVSGRRFITEPPVVAQPIADLVVPVNAAPTVIDVSGVFTDPDIPSGDVLTLSVTSDNPAVVAASLNAAGTQLTLTYGANQSGAANVTVRATDLAGLFVEDAFTATVSPFFNPPTVAQPVADVTADEDAVPLVINLSGVFTDPDLPNGDVLTLSAVSANPALVAASVAGTQLTLTFQPNANGIAAVTVTATDRAGQSVSDTFSVAVTPVNNDSPTVAQPIAGRTAFENALPLVIDLAAVFTDPDLPNGDLLALSALSDNPGLVGVSVTGSQLTLAFQPNSSGVATVSVTATDLSGLTVMDAFTVTVSGASNVEPVSARSGVTGNRPSFLDTALEQATSADGRFVVFTSEAANLAGPGQDLNGLLTDIFLYDRVDQSVTLISRKAGAFQTANADSFSPLISDDGMKVAFLSAATNLVPGQVDTNGVEDLFLFDRTTGTMSLISHAPGLPTTTGDGAVISATMSADGTAIAFDSLATNLVTLTFANAAFTNPGGGLVAAGAPHPIHGFPTWYQDSNGVAIELMPFYQGQAPFNNGQLLVPDPMSISAPPEPGNVFSETIGFGEEAFWWAADAGIDMGGFGLGLLVLAQEAAFMGDASPVFGNQFAFGRIRTRFDVPVDGTYTVTHPYGEILFKDLVAGERLFYSNDNGDVYPYQSNRLLSADPVGPFLVAANAPPGFLGDPAVPSTVTGSPLGPDRNYFSIRGPFNGPGTDVTFSTDLFTVVGRRYTSDTNNAPDVFLWKTDPGTPGGVIELVSRAAGSTVETGNGASRNPIIDPSGGSVLYTSEATNLVAFQDDTNGFTDVFLFNDQLQTTALVSGASGSQSVTANGASQAEAIDSLGALAVISSTATNLATELDLAGAIVPVAIQDTNLGRDIYLFDAGTRVMTLVSHAAGNPTQAANAASAAPTISADGRFVAFTSRASNLAAGVSDAAGFQDVFLYDRLTDSSGLVSHTAGSATIPANSDSSAPVLSFDGRFVAFESLGTNLVKLAVDTNGSSDIFVLDRVTGIMKLASHVPLAAPTDPPTAGNGASTHPAISANGLSIVFNSSASNLFPSDGNAFSDVFLFAAGANHAPVLDPTKRPSLAPINEGAIAGTTVDAILATPGLYSDADDTSLKGIAIVGQDQANGAWEFSTNGGAQWTPLGVVGENLAILLSADGTGQNRVRFLPTDPLFAGTATFTFRGWDRTDGNPSGATGINVSVNGGETAYSAEIATAEAPVSPFAQHQPTVALPIIDATVTEDALPVVVDLSGVFADADIANGDQLALSVVNDNPGLVAADLAGTQLTLTFQPNQTGAATVSVTATDLAGLKATDTFTVTVNPVNDAPTLTIIPNPPAINEDAGAQTVSLSGIGPGGAPDEAGQTLTVTATSNNPGLIPNPVVSYTSPNAAGSLSFTPAANANGAAVITVTVTDSGNTVNGGVNSFSRSFTVTVNPLNDVPTVLQPIADLTGLGSSPVVIELGAVFADVDIATNADQLALSVVNDNPGVLTASLTGTQLTLTFQPNPSGPLANVSVTATDLAGAQATDIFTVTVSPFANPPTVAAPIADVTAAEDDPPVVLDLSGVFADADIASNGDFLTLSVVNGNPALVAASLAGTQLTLTFQPNQNGAATVSVTATDRAGLTVTDPFAVTVAPVNDPPVANAQTVTTSEDTSKVLVLTATDIDGDPLTYTVVAGPASGTLSGTAPNLTYTPAANYNGPDSFTFKANDGTIDSAVATVAITVTPVNDAPVANAQVVSTNEDSAAAIVLTSSDVDGDPLTYTVVAGPANGTLSGTAPNLTYTPAANFNGPDSFTFKVHDGTVDSAAATVAITVAPVNDVPVADAQTVSTNEDTSKAVVLTASDIDGDPLTYTVVAAPAHGTLSGTAPNLTYTPAANYNGADSFTFKVHDGTVDSAVATVAIAVAPVNDAPVANAQTVTTEEDARAAIALTASDVDGDLLTYTVVAAPIHGTLNSSAPNVTYTPAPDYFGPDSFTFRANDGIADSAAATVSITVNGAPPAATINQAATQPGVAVEGPIHFTATFSDPVTGFDGADLRLSGTASGSLVATITQADSDGMIYDVAVSGMTGRGTVIAQIRADAAVDRAGHFNTASTSTDNEVFFEPPQVSDNNDPSFAFTGRWGAHPGYRGGSLVSLNRVAGTTATWTKQVTPGRYQVLATWTAGTRHATNAPFTIFDGGVTTARVVVNQRQAPADLTWDGVGWKAVGTFNVFSGSLVVGLNSVANGAVDADAVRIVRVGDLVPTTTRIIDDGDFFFATQGAWFAATRVGVQGDVRRHVRGGGADTATWTFLVEPGEYQVAATWAVLAGAATNSPFTVTGATSLTTRLNQRVAPNDFTNAGVAWENLGTVTVTGHVLSVRLSDLANGTVMADAIRIQKVIAPGAAAVAQSASARALDATLAALAASGGSAQLPSLTSPPKRQQAAIDAILADPGAQLQGP